MTDHCKALGRHVKTAEELLAEVTEYARRELSPARFRHSEGVAEEAARIGAAEGLDTGKCRLAGMLHDIAREYTDGQYAELWRKAGISGRDGEEPFDRVLRHGKAAAMIASAKFRITDFDVLDAVMWHTTGRAGLTRLGQVLFVADYTEAGRTGEHFDRVRTVLARFGLMAAVAEECRLTILYRASKHLIPMDEQETFAAPADINMYTVETLNWALGELARERGQHGHGGNS